MVPPRPPPDLQVRRTHIDAAGLDPAGLLRLSLATRSDGSRPAAADRRFFFSAPDTGRTLVALGRIAGADGAAAWHAPARVREEAARALGPAAVDVPWCAGVAFDPTAGGTAGAGSSARRRDPWRAFPAASLWLPEISLVVEDGRATLAVAGIGTTGRALARVADDVRRRLDRPDVAEPAAGAGTGRGADVDPPPEGRSMLGHTERAALRRRIVRVLEAIRRGEVEKVVVATRHTERTGRAVDPVNALARLRAAQSGCFHYQVELRRGHALVGASPERLAEVVGRRARTMALAGSAPRGQDDAEDRALGEALLGSAKDRSEHALVVDAIRAALAPLAASVDIPDDPRLLKLATIQHLYTPIEARLSGPTDVLGLAARLHPTPALAGTPRSAALDVIRAVEGGLRGWYGGVLGWVDGDGNGDLAVAIRCALVAGGAATAFAGAGIVAASDPDREVEEIALKLGAALAAVRHARD